MVLALKLIAPTTAPETIRYVAVLQSPDKKDAGWIVEASVGGKLRLTPLATTTVAPQKVLQFWTKAQSASGPTSLGLVAPDRVTEIDVARLPTLEREQLFELTLEPEGGSTIGRPDRPDTVCRAHGSDEPSLKLLLSSCGNGNDGAVVNGTQPDQKSFRLIRIQAWSPCVVPDETPSLGYSFTHTL